MLCDRSCIESGGENSPKLFPLIMVSFVTAGVSAAHVAVLAVLVTGATGQHGGAEPGDRVVLRAHPGMMSGESILNKLNIKVILGLFRPSD